MRATHCIESSLADWRASLQRNVLATGSLRTASLARIDTLSLADPCDVELAEYVNLLEDIGAAHGRSWLSWTTGCGTILPFGGRFGGSILGCCRTLGTALEWLCRYFPLY